MAVARFIKIGKCATDSGTFISYLRVVEEREKREREKERKKEKRGEKKRKRRIKKIKHTSAVYYWILLLKINFIYLNN
jgi:hypothetical protein